MTAADVSAIAESVLAVIAAGGLAAWLWRTSTRLRKWRQRKQAERIRDAAFPMVAVVAVVTLLLARVKGGGE